MLESDVKFEEVRRQDGEMVEDGENISLEIGCKSTPRCEGVILFGISRGGYGADGVQNPEEAVEVRCRN